jgi:hypothetical protein
VLISVIFSSVKGYRAMHIMDNKAPIAGKKLNIKRIPV